MGNALREWWWMDWLLGSNFIGSIFFLIFFGVISHETWSVEEIASLHLCWD